MGMTECLGQISIPPLADTLFFSLPTHHPGSSVASCGCGPGRTFQMQQTPRPLAPLLRRSCPTQALNRRSVDPTATHPNSPTRRSRAAVSSSTASVDPQVSRQSSQSSKTGRSPPLINSLFDRLGGVLWANFSSSNDSDLASDPFPPTNQSTPHRWLIPIHIPSTPLGSGAAAGMGRRTAAAAAAAANGSDV